MVHIVELLQKLFEDPREKMAQLKRKMTDLESREEDIKTELNSVLGTWPRKRRKKSVESWLNQVIEIRTRVIDLDRKVPQVGLLNHLSLSTAIDRVASEVSELSKQVFLNGLVFEARDIQSPELVITSAMVGKRFKAMKSWISEILMSENGVSSVGIFGMGGIGKTTLVSHVYNELLSRPKTRVFWVTVSRNFSLRKLQSDVAKALSIDLGNEDEEKIRAAIIARDLKRRRGTVVLILDELWTAFPLERLGFCVGEQIKLVFTTRSLEVCDRMACNERVELSPLDDGEAWILFTKTLGDGTKLGPQVEETAKSLAKECAGLPLGIVAIAGSMRGIDDLHEWQSALDGMRSRSSDDDNDVEIEVQKVFRALRHSYDALESVAAKECFLYCALFPKDCKIRRNDLIMYFVDEGLIKGRNNGHCLLRKLERVCLLQGGPNWKYLKMHDLVREMAVRIGTENGLFRVGAGLKFVIDVAGEEIWSVELKRVSFIGRFLLDTLRDAMPPKCPKISTFLLRGGYNITVIPDDFFAHMDGLTILDLSRTGIVSLPLSVSNLKGLIALLLGSCSKLERVVPLSGLRALKRLDLSCTGIRELPEGIEMLSNLRDLNLHRAKCLRAIPDGVLSKLSCLEHLALPKLRIGETMANEIAGLGALERFKGEYYRTKDLDLILKSWNKGNPKEYVLLGDEVLWRDLYDVSGENERHVSVKKCDDLSSLCELKSLKNARGLRTCYVGESDKIVRLFCREGYYLPFFRSLEILCLDSLLKLRGLISPVSRPRLVESKGSFSSLRGFRMYKCPKIESLFTLELMSDLKNLESLKVCDCTELVEIVDHEASFEQSYALPKLKQLKLWDLPKLKRFWRSGKMAVLCSLEEIEIVGCPKLESLPLAGHFFAQVKSPFSSLKEVTIKRCCAIKNLFALAPPFGLENIEKLFVHDCDELVEIVQVFLENVDHDVVDVLPRLKVLKLKSLPRLKRFCSSGKVVLDSVEEISIINCPNLMSFPLIREDLNPSAAIRCITVEDEWWESVNFDRSITRDFLRPMCDFRRRTTAKSLSNDMSSDFDRTANL